MRNVFLLCYNLSTHEPFGYNLPIRINPKNYFAFYLAQIVTKPLTCKQY